MNEAFTVQRAISCEKESKRVVAHVRELKNLHTHIHSHTNALDLCRKCESESCGFQNFLSPPQAMEHIEPFPSAQTNFLGKLVWSHPLGRFVGNLCEAKKEKAI